MSRLAAFAILVSALAASTAQAQIQKKGPEVWPGPNELSLHIGFQNPLVGYDLNGLGGLGGPPSGFQIKFDYAYRFSNPGRYSVWFDIGFSSVVGGCSVGLVGPLGGYSYSCGGNSFEPGAGIKIKWRTPIPLVPYFKATANFAGIFNRYCGESGFGVVVKPAGGVKYFLTKNIGVGIETGFTFGPVWYGGTPSSNAPCNDHYWGIPSHGEFYGAIDFTAGGEYVF